MGLTQEVGVSWFGGLKPTSYIFQEGTRNTNIVNYPELGFFPYFFCWSGDIHKEAKYVTLMEPKALICKRGSKKKPQSVAR